MRKLLFILSLSVCCLFVAAGTSGVDAESPLRSAELSIDRASDDELLCEMECNSDLNLPRGVREVSPVQQSVPGFSRGGISVGAEAAARHASGAVRAGLLRSFTFFQPFVRLSGARAADYYVYRLRRLII